MAGRRARRPQRRHVEAEEPDTAQQPPVQGPHLPPGSLQPGGEPAQQSWRPPAQPAPADRQQRGERQHDHRDEDREHGVAEVVWPVRHAREQQHGGGAVDGEPDRGEQEQQRGAALEQLAPGDAVATHQQAGRGRRGDVPAGQDRSRAHRDPGHPAADRARRLGEEAPEDDDVAQARPELEPDRGAHPRRAHVADLVDDLPRRSDERQRDERHDAERADSQRPPPQS